MGIYNTKCRRGRLVQWKSTRFAKFRPRGPRFETRHGFYLFRRESNYLRLALKFDGNFRHMDMSINHHATSIRKAVATFYYCMKRKRSLGNWSYDVILESGTTSYTLLRNSSNLRRYFYAFKLTAGTNRDD